MRGLSRRSPRGGCQVSTNTVRCPLPPRPFPPPSPPHLPLQASPLAPCPLPPALPTGYLEDIFKYRHEKRNLINPRSSPPALSTGYLEDIFKYHHEKRNLIKIPTPQVPTWKGLDERDEEEDEIDVPGVCLCRYARV